MFKHEKPLLREVKVENANPQYAVLIRGVLSDKACINKTW